MRLTLRPVLTVCALITACFVSACTLPSDAQKASGEVFDPHENRNRGVHKFNLGVDKVLFRPASKGYVSVIPGPIQTSIGNFAQNLAMPSHAVDFILQGRPKDAMQAVGRFLMNSTIGFGGLADPATEFGMPPAETDFGETLHVWGFEEGAYVELPFFGPSTQRDTVGLVVALFTNPVSFTLTRPVNNTRFWAEILRRMGDRGNYSDTVDSILYESADSYAQARLIYLQNRRFELDGGADDPNYDNYADPYADLYEDPYAE